MYSNKAIQTSGVNTETGKFHFVLTRVVPGVTWLRETIAVKVTGYTEWGKIIEKGFGSHF